MAKMNISMPDEMKAFVDDQASRKGFSTASEYVRAIIREAQERDGQRERLDALLLDGLNSGRWNSALQGGLGPHPPRGSEVNRKTQTQPEMNRIIPQVTSHLDPDFISPHLTAEAVYRFRRGSSCSGRRRGGSASDEAGRRPRRLRSSRDRASRRSGDSARKVPREGRRAGKGPASRPRRPAKARGLRPNRPLGKLATTRPFPASQTAAARIPNNLGLASEVCLPVDSTQTD